MKHNDRLMQIYLDGTATPQALYAIYEATRTLYRLDGSSEALVRAICSCTPASPIPIKGDDRLPDSMNQSPLVTLALMYVEMHASVEMAPAELYAMYLKAKDEIQAEYARLKSVRSKEHS